MSLSPEAGDCNCSSYPVFSVILKLFSRYQFRLLVKNYLSIPTACFLEDREEKKGLGV